MLVGVLAPIEDRERHLDGPGVDLADALAGLGDPGQFRPQLFGFVPVLPLLDRACEVGVEQPVLHPGQFRVPFGERRRLPALLGRDVLERRGERFAEEISYLLRLDPERRQLVGDRVLDILGPPPDPGVPRLRMVVGAAVVEMLVDCAVLEFSPDAFTGDGKAAMGTAHQAARQRDLRLARSTVLPMQDVLAGVEELASDQPLVLTLKHLAIAGELADVEPVVQDVRERRAGESRLARPIDVSFTLQPVSERLEGHVASRIELEDANDGLRFLGVRLDRLLSIVLDVDVSVRREAGRPALPHLLVHALEDLGAQVVTVVLRHRRHHVERQRSRSAGTELVLDEGELHAAGVLKLLQPHRIAHVAAHAVELVAQDRFDLLAPGVCPYPLEHLVEGDAFGASPRRLRDLELANDLPAFSLGLLTRRAKLCVDRVALALLAR